MVAMLRDKGGKLQESLSGMQVVAYCESIVAEFQVTHKILFQLCVAASKGDVRSLRLLIDCAGLQVS